MNVHHIPYQQTITPSPNEWQAHSLPNDLYPATGDQPVQLYYPEQGASPSIYMPSEPPAQTGLPPSRPISIAAHSGETWKTSSRMSVGTENWKVSSRTAGMALSHNSPSFDQQLPAVAGDLMGFSSPVHAHWQPSQALDLATSHVYSPAKPLPQEPPHPPPRHSMQPGGFVLPPQQPSPIIPIMQQQFPNAQHWDYSPSAIPSSFGGYSYENTPYSEPGFQDQIPSAQPMQQQPPLEPQQQQYTSPLQSSEKPPASPLADEAPDKKKKEKEPERKQRQITVQSVNKEHRVWIDILPNETGASLAKKIHIIATFQTRKVLSITTKSGRSIQLNHRPVFVNWKDMEDFEDGEKWEVELGERDRGMMEKVDKVFSKMVQASGRRNK